MLSSFTIALTAILSFVHIIPKVSASPCVVFDADFNLLVLGLGGKDWNLGQQSTWASSGSANDITASGRPSFDGTNTTCYLAQFFNAIYVINGDSSGPNNVGIYDAGAKSWTTQTVTPGTFDASNFVAILDHDTNVFYALSGGNLFFLNFASMKAANSTPIPWTSVEAPNFSTTGYQPVMALAQNHIHFLDVPGAQPGTAQIFVIHFSFFQPDPQSYPINGSSSNFPETHGQTASFFQTEGVQQEFAFIPDDHSQTYVINVESNTTAMLAGPTDKSTSTFTASITSLVQLTSAGELFFLPYQEGAASTNAAAKWTQVTLSGLPSPSSSSSAGGSTSTGGGSSGGSSPTKTGSSTTGAPTATGSSKSGATSRMVTVIRSAGLAGLLVVLGVILL